MLPDYKYVVNRNERKTFSVLVDGIYTKRAIFTDTIVHGVTIKHEAFVGAQERVRKDVERSFGLLLSR